MERAVGFWEAWQLWAAGSPIQPLVLWGQPILWWGRIGKIAQFAAGLVIILDLVGAERLRAWAHRSTYARYGH